ncbi:SCO4226 family nickel-binding protein [Yinghuangia sp. YIM S09857]|uniref:SCO4226 family nickel-binding protein n=1 Tax=Yinghuangia sp. YIM S09857 TaxID=3436929 RepID=UPI003F53D082
MPVFMDVHRNMRGISADDLKAAHQQDLALQDMEHVEFKHAWADPESGMVFCLAEGPDADAVRRVHAMAGHPADDVYPVTLEV